MYHLMRKDLWDLFEDEEEDVNKEDAKGEGDAKVHPKTKTWKKMNNKALGIIAWGLSDDVLHHISGIRDAKKAWEELDRIFGTQAKNSKVKLLMQFYKLDVKDSPSMTVHINKFKSLKTQLATLKKTIDEDEAIAVLLASVNHEPYENLVSTLSNVPSLSLKDVEHSLLD